MACDTRGEPKVWPRTGESGLHEWLSGEVIRSGDTNSSRLLDSDGLLVAPGVTG